MMVYTILKYNLACTDYNFDRNLNMGDVLANVRKNLSISGTSELSLLHKHEALNELYESRQQLLSEMNTAKRTAAEQAVEPYLEKLKELDISYAAILSLLPKD
jgi:hypothetical protein